MRALLLFLALLTTPTPPPFLATWTSPTSARLVWTQPLGIHLTCLRRESTPIGCMTDAPAGLTVVELGSQGSTDGRMRPRAGDVFTLELDGQETRAPLLQALYLPGITKPPAVVGWRLWVGVAMRG